MAALSNWDWDTKEKLISNINDWKKKFLEVRELVPSDSGEKIAAVVQTKDGFTTCINGEPWVEVFERVWSLKFNNGDQLVSLVYRNYEWFVATGKEMWEDAFDEVWNMQLTPDGTGVVANVKRNSLSAE